jgi:hypothetical protein
LLVCALIADGVNEGGYHEPELGAEYCEQEPEVPNTESELPEDFEDGVGAEYGPDTNQ